MTSYHEAGKVKHKPTPAKEWLRKNYDYDPSTGKLVRKKDCEKGCRTPYETVQGKAKKRRLVIPIGQNVFKHARIVLAWHYGDPCHLQVDHIDGNTVNDRIENLRLATNSQNNANKSKSKGYSQNGGRWYVDVMKDQKSYKGGAYRTEAEAAKVARALKKTLFGEFSNYESGQFVKPVKKLESLPLFDGATK